MYIVLYIVNSFIIRVIYFKDIGIEFLSLICLINQSFSLLDAFQKKKRLSYGFGYKFARIARSRTFGSGMFVTVSVILLYPPNDAIEFNIYVVSLELVCHNSLTGINFGFISGRLNDVCRTFSV